MESGLVLVADALDRDDPFVADLLAQFADVHVDRAVADYHVGAPDFGVDLFAGEEFAGLRVEQVEQCELLAGKENLLTVARHGVAFAIDHNSRFGRLSRFALLVNPFQNRLHAAYQQLHLDRLSEVVVGSNVESGNLLLLVAQCGEKNDHRVAQLGIFANGAAGLCAVHHGHHHVEQDEVGVVLAGYVECFGAVLCREDFVALAGKVIFDKFEDVGFVVDKQNAVRHSGCLFGFGAQLAAEALHAMIIMCEVNKFPANSFGSPGKMVIFASSISSRHYWRGKINVYCDGY